MQLWHSDMEELGGHSQAVPGHVFGKERKSKQGSLFQAYIADIALVGPRQGQVWQFCP
jgi:hypothetical protein